MSYRIRVSEHAQKQIRKLDPQAASTIRRFLEERLAVEEDPRRLGKALQSEERLWRYRVGDYRIIVQIQDDVLVVLVVDVGHRRDVYR